MSQRRGGGDQAIPINDNPGASVRITLETPTESPVDSENQIQAIVQDETDIFASIRTTASGAVFGLGTAPPHALIDVAESAAQNNAGKPTTVPQKSTVVVTGDTQNKSVQPAFTTSQMVPRAQADEIERLYRFVTGNTATVYQEGGRMYYDTKRKRLKHANLDVAEILARRVGDANGITLTNHTVEPRSQR